MTGPQRAFCSFSTIPNAADHRAFNAWHQLDHRPENLALPGVLGGERWVRTPRCAAASIASEMFADLHYLNLYWFVDDAAVRGWEELAEQTFQLGRRADIHLSRRILMEHFRPIDTVVAPALALSPDALRHRPNRGIVAIVTRNDEPRSAAAERRNAWWASEHLPAQLARPGVAGAWTLASASGFAVHADLSDAPPPPSTRVIVLVLDEDPVEVAATFDAIAPDPAGAEQFLFAGPLEVITPWQWDWFD